MNRRFVPIAILLPLVLVSLASMRAAPKADPPATPQVRDLTVHEWGTFTSIADPQGRALEWNPLDRVDDLPCFIEHYRYLNKGSLPGTVRMETPVLYFYSPAETTVNVHVRFHQGAITEWYPAAAVTPREYRPVDSIETPDFTSEAAWTNVKVMPGNITPQLRDEGTASHYYLARNTDAAPVQIGDQQEKFLFYRGVASFQPPIAAMVAEDGTVSVKNPSGESLGDLILFEHRGGRMAYRVQQIGDSEVTLSPPTLVEGSGAPTQEMEQILIAHGLFPREAQAMVDTWRDSWFEEGSRLFYIASRKAIDDVLPLEIAPKPAEVTRAFVGRVELITTRTRQEVALALEKNDLPTLRKYGRFTQSIGWEILKPLPRPELERLARPLGQLVTESFNQQRARCPQQSTSNGVGEGATQMLIQASK
jgi:hypothetical protein